MRPQRLLAVFSAGLMILLAAAALSAAAQARQVQSGMVFEHGSVRLLVTDGLDFLPSLLKDGSALSFAEVQSTGRPSFYAVFGGLEVTEFVADWSALKTEEVDEPGLGRGV
ncbi:MAG: hypothetical protein HOC20_12175, partial [Chloroflexi bacterium]|nr:hypothetical protein [Chloroflexota bacterium]